MKWLIDHEDPSIYYDTYRKNAPAGANMIPYEGMGFVPGGNAINKLIVQPNYEKKYDVTIKAMQSATKFDLYIKLLKEGVITQDIENLTTFEEAKARSSQYVKENEILNKAAVWADIESSMSKKQLEEFIRLYNSKTYSKIKEKAKVKALKESINNKK
jgi:hypothetical protein